VRAAYAPLCTDVLLSNGVPPVPCQSLVDDGDGVWLLAPSAAPPAAITSLRAD
jgi:hypothetical protein